MKSSEIRDLTPAELASKARELRSSLFNLQLQKASSQLEKPGQLRNLRKDIARVETQISALRKKSK